MSMPKDDADLTHTRKVSRLPPLPAVLDPILEENFANIRARGGQILNLHRAAGHAPLLARARTEFVWVLRDACLIPRQMRELAILRVAYLADCDYELHHHVPLAKRAGLSVAQIEALRDWRADQELFDDRDRALLAYVDGIVIHRGEVDDATFSELSRHFRPQEIVELTMCATSYYANAFYLKALQVEMDPPEAQPAPGRF